MMALAARSMVETDSCNQPKIQVVACCLPVEVARPAVAVSMTPSRLRLKSMQISLGSFFFFLDKR